MPASFHDRFAYIGGDRALVRLPGGETLVVDTASVDALDYLLGWSIEQDVVPVVRRCLTSSSVFLDVGANWGFYTITFAHLLKNAGRIHAFEANPANCDLLLRSLYANRLLGNPRIAVHHLAVHDRPGTVTLHLNPARSGGASLWGQAATGHFRPTTSLEVPAAALDDVLPEDLVVDVAKIDVEGHEPFVLRGMRRIIARSPSIRIICEFFPGNLRPACDPACFIEEVRAMGLAVWTIGEGGALRPFDPALDLVAERYCLFARQLTDLPDYTIMPASLSFPPAYRGDDRPSLLREQRLVYAARDWPGQGEDTLCYGPYCTVAPGRYTLRLHGQVHGGFTARVTRDFGTRIAEGAIAGESRTMAFDNPDWARDFEIVLRRTPRSRHLDLERITLTREPG